jgi:hypothetical protein
MTDTKPMDSPRDRANKFSIQLDVAMRLFASGASAPGFTEDGDGVEPDEFWHASAWRAWEFAGFFIEEMERRQKGERHGRDNRGSTPAWVKQWELDHPNL